MRKALVLALVLVFAIAGASMAATPSFSGELEVKASSPNSFTGPFGLEHKLTVDLDFAEEGDNWTFDARLRSVHTSNAPVGVSLNRYKGVFEGDGFTATVARNYGLGKVATPFDWVVLATNPVDSNNRVDQVRLEANLGGVDVTTQLRGDNNNLYLRAQTEAGLATIGTGMQIDLSPAKDSVYTGYLTTSVDIVDLRAMVGSFAGTTEYAVGASADLTEQLNVGATYSSLNHGNVTKGFAVDATFTEGLIQAYAEYAQEDSAYEVSLVYRGSEGNLSFDDLFDHGEDAWEDHWHENVAPAFGVSYSDDSAPDAAVIEVDVVLPVADNFAARAHFQTQGGKSEYELEGRLGLTDKLTLNVYFEKDDTDQTIGAKATYAVGEDASITVTAEREGNIDSLVAAYKISF